MLRRVAVPLSLTPQAARPHEGRLATLGGRTMGVTWSLRARAPAGVGDAALSAAVQGVCDAVVAQMSTWEPDSDISRYNRAAAGRWVEAPEHLMTVLRAAMDVAELSGGAFDPTVGPIVDLWGFGPAGAVAAEPAPDALRATAIGWRGVRIDAEHRRIYQPGGLALDLSAIAKGFAVDLAGAALEMLGVRDYLLEIGGELKGGGVKGDGEPWWVEIEPPPESDLAEPPILVALHGLSIATSGDWRRTWSAGGRRYSHTVDPAIRAPVDGGVAAVSVLHAACMQADALCTVLTVLGPGAEDFARRYGIAAQIVRRTPCGFHEWVSPTLASLLD